MKILIKSFKWKKILTKPFNGPLTNNTKSVRSGLAKNANFSKFLPKTFKTSLTKTKAHNNLNISPEKAVFESESDCPPGVLKYSVPGLGCSPRSSRVLAALRTPHTKLRHFDTYVITTGARGSRISIGSILVLNPGGKTLRRIGVGVENRRALVIRVRVQVLVF